MGTEKKNRCETHRGRKKRRMGGIGPGRLHPCTGTPVRKDRRGAVRSVVELQKNRRFGELHAVLVYLTRPFPVSSQKHGL